MSDFQPHIMVHEITPGDTFYSLAKQYDTTIEVISKANPEVDPEFLKVGHKILIPLPNPKAIANIRGGP
ncbi:MAG: LysM domain-containing protein, partial [Tepidanaerobacteraceae bacterium]